MALRKNSRGDRLRRRAEKLIAEKPGAPPKLSSTEIKKLLHELNVYQVELEKQNDELRKSQEEIEVSRSKYVDLYDFFPVGYFVSDRQGKIIDANLTGAKMLGIERSRLIGRSFAGFLVPGYRDVFRTHREVVLKTLEKDGCEVKIKKKDGTIFHASIESAILAGREDGFRVRTAVTDITERKKAQEEVLRLNFELEEKVKERTAQLEAANKVLENEIAQRKRAEEAVRRKEGEFRAIFELSSVGMAQRDPLTHRLTRANSKLCEMIGYSAKELLTKTHMDITHPDDREKEDQEWNRILQDKTDAWSIEKRYIRKNGEVIWAHVNGRLLRDESGRPFRTIAVIQDITERKRAEEALKKSKEKFELLSETAGRLLASDRPQEVVNELCRKVMAYLECHVFFNFLVAEEGQRLHLNAYAGIPEETAREIEWLNFGVAVCGCAARDGLRIIAENIPETPDPRTDLVRSFGIQAYACHPLLARGKVIGTLSFGTRSRISFTGDELALMKTVADQIAAAMERILFLKEISHQADQLEKRVRERTEELAQANRELMEQSRVLEGFFLSSITPLVFLDKNFNFIRVNEAYAEACARDASEFIGRNHFELYPHEENEAIFRKVVETKTPYKATAKAFTFPEHPEGGVTYWDWILTPVLDNQGDVEFLVFSLNNVTEQVHAEEELWQASLYARSLLEASLDPLVTIDTEGRIMDVNHATELMTGWSRENLIGTDFSDYFTEPDKAKEGYQQVFSKGMVRDYPLALLHRSGKITDVLYNATVYKDEAGEVQGVFAAARDITDIKRVQEALRDSENQLRKLSAQLLTAQEIERKRVSRELHDGLQQTLTAIKFKVESYLLQARKTRMKAKAQTLEPIVTLIQECVQEIRRIQADLRPPMLEDLGILACVSWICREFQNAYPAIQIEKTIQIEETDIPEDIKMVIYRILQEALNNIAKHSEADRASLFLRKIENVIELMIQDNGRGFEAQEILSGAKITMGLGLGSMRERTEAADGVFAVESAKGKGTTIQVSWAL